MLDGALTVWVGDAKVELTSGGFAFGPKGVPHTFYGTAPVTRALVGFAPMQFEGFLRAVGHPAPVRERTSKIADAARTCQRSRARGRVPPLTADNPRG